MELSKLSQIPLDFHHFHRQKHRFLLKLLLTFQLNHAIQEISMVCNKYQFLIQSYAILTCNGQAI